MQLFLILSGMNSKIILIYPTDGTVSSDACFLLAEKNHMVSANTSDKGVF